MQKNVFDPWKYGKARKLLADWPVWTYRILDSTRVYSVHPGRAAAGETIGDCLRNWLNATSSRSVERPIPIVWSRILKALSAETEREITALLRDGNKLRAIKVYKLATGTNLVVAKEAVESMMRDEASVAGGQDYVSQQDQVLDAIFRNETLNAIKIYRRSSGASLKESKEFVEALTAELRTESPEQFTPKSVGCAGTLIVCLLLVGAAYLL